MIRYSRMNPYYKEPRNDRRNGLIARFRDGAPRYVSVPVGVLLIVGGLFGFLPVLGLWMLPMGLAILAPNVPFAGRLLRRLIRFSIRRGLVRIKRRDEKA
jgi:hypothetical protein